MSWLSDILRPSLGKLFNQYADAFNYRVRECDTDIIIETGGIKFLLFGSQERKAEAWHLQHPGTPTPYFCCVSSKPVEIWGDVRSVMSFRKALRGKLVVNQFSLGHELLHALRVIQSNWTLQNEEEGVLLSPDKYVDM